MLHTTPLVKMAPTILQNTCNVLYLPQHNQVLANVCRGNEFLEKKLNVPNRIFYGATEIEVDLVPADRLRANQGNHRTKLFDVGHRTPSGIKKIIVLTLL